MIVYLTASVQNYDSFGLAFGEPIQHQKKLKLSFQIPEPVITPGISDLSQLKDAPVPRINSMSNTGLLEIIFSKPLKLRQDWHNHLQLDIKTSALQHNKYALFDWEVARFDQDKLAIQVNFTTPHMVSWLSQSDQLELVFLTQDSAFIGQNGIILSDGVSQVLSGQPALTVYLNVQIPQQMQQSDVDVDYFIVVLSMILKWTFYTLLIYSFISGAGWILFLDAIIDLTIFCQMLLINIPSSAIGNNFFKVILSIPSLNFHSLDFIYDKIFTDSSQLNDTKLAALGYQSNSLAQNMGFLCVALLLYPAFYFLLFLVDKTCAPAGSASWLLRQRSWKCAVVANCLFSTLWFNVLLALEFTHETKNAAESFSLIASIWLSASLVAFPIAMFYIYYCFWVRRPTQFTNKLNNKARDQKFKATFGLLTALANFKTACDHTEHSEQNLLHTHCKDRVDRGKRLTLAVFQAGLLRRLVMAFTLVFLRQQPAIAICLNIALSLPMFSLVQVTKPFGDQKSKSDCSAKASELACLVLLYTLLFNADLLGRVKYEYFLHNMPTSLHFLQWQVILVTLLYFVVWLTKLVSHQIYETKRLLLAFARDKQQKRVYPADEYQSTNQALLTTDTLRIFDLESQMVTNCHTVETEEVKLEPHSQGRSLKTLPFVRSIERQEGLRLHVILKDGNCLFRCLSFLILAEEALHGQVREQVVLKLMDNKQHYRSLMSSTSQNLTNQKQDFDKYCETMRRSGQAAGSLELQAAADLYAVNIQVYSQHSTLPEVIQSCNADELTEVISMCQIDEQHYCPLLKATSDHIDFKCSKGIDLASDMSTAMKPLQNISVLNETLLGSLSPVNRKTTSNIESKFQLIPEECEIDIEPVNLKSTALQVSKRIKDKSKSSHTVLAVPPESNASHSKTGCVHIAMPPAYCALLMYDDSGDTSLDQTDQLFAHAEERNQRSSSETGQVRPEAFKENQLEFVYSPPKQSVVDERETLGLKSDGVPGILDSNFESGRRRPYGLEMTTNQSQQQTKIKEEPSKNHSETDDRNFNCKAALLQLKMPSGGHFPLLMFCDESQQPNNSDVDPLQGKLSTNNSFGQLNLPEVSESYLHIPSQLQTLKLTHDSQTQTRMPVKQSMTSLQSLISSQDRVLSEFSQQKAGQTNPKQIQSQADTSHKGERIHSKCILRPNSQLKSEIENSRVKSPLQTYMDQPLQQKSYAQIPQTAGGSRSPVQHQNFMTGEKLCSLGLQTINLDQFAIQPKVPLLNLNTIYVPSVNDQVDSIFQFPAKNYGAQRNLSTPQKHQIVQESCQGSANKVRNSKRQKRNSGAVTQRIHYTTNMNSAYGMNYSTYRRSPSSGQRSTSLKSSTRYKDIIYENSQFIQKGGLRANKAKAVAIHTQRIAACADRVQSKSETGSQSRQNRKSTAPGKRRSSRQSANTRQGLLSMSVHGCTPEQRQKRAHLQFKLKSDKPDKVDALVKRVTETVTEGDYDKMTLGSVYGETDPTPLVQDLKEAVTHLVKNHQSPLNMELVRKTVYQLRQKRFEINCNKKFLPFGSKSLQ